ncbi:MAG: dephospho-CoA kinase [Kiloniellales bacterium]
MIVLGLTGSIGMGKTAAAGMLRRMGLPLHDADKTVHRLLGPGGATAAAVEAAFPGVAVDGAIDRKHLGARVFDHPAELKRLEAILHPMVRRSALDFLKQKARQGHSLVVLDIPLLFETGAEALCDAVVVVTAPRFVQEARVMGRSGMTPQRLRAILAAQMPDEEKQRRADFVINTGLSKRETLRQLRAAVRLLRHRARRAHGAEP